MEGGYLSLEKKKDNEKTIMIVYRYMFILL